MITCINLSKPRLKIKEKYDDIMLGYKLSYSKDERENHKRLAKRIGMFALIIIAKHLLFDATTTVHACANPIQDIANDDWWKDMQGIDHMPKNEVYDNIINQSQNDVNRIFENTNRDMDIYWNNLNKGIDEMMKPTYDHVDRVLDNYTNNLEMIRQEYERISHLSPSQRLAETSSMDLGKMMDLYYESLNIK